MGGGRKNEHRLFPTKDGNNSSEGTATRISISQVAGTIRNSSRAGLRKKVPSIDVLILVYSFRSLWGR